MQMQRQNKKAEIGKRSLLLGGLLSLFVEVSAWGANGTDDDSARIEDATQKERNTPHFLIKELGITKEFFDLQAELPWLHDTRKSVGRLSRTGAIALVGTALLLDDQGTLAFLAHELPASGKISVRFYGPDKLLGLDGSVPVTLVAYDGSKDLAFGQIAPQIVRKLGLIPIQWNNKPADRTDRVVVVGFPRFDDQGVFFDAALHAEIGSGALPEDQPTANGHAATCKVRTKNTGFLEEPGGVVYSDSGEFLGIFNASGEPGAPANLTPASDGFFTPADAVWAEYSALFLTRSRAVEPSTVPAPPKRPECAYRDGLLTPFRK